MDSFFGEPYLVTIIFTFLIFAAAIVTLRIIILICIFFIEENHITLPWKDIEDFFQSGGNDTINFKIQGIGLVEPRTLRRSIGVGGGKGGIGAGTSLSFHAGTEQTKIDSGTICFDKIQISFIGSTKQVTWRWNKILSVRVSHGLTSSTIFVVVSSRKNISGFMLPSSKEDAERLSTYISEHSTDSEK